MQAAPSATSEVLYGRRGRLGSNSVRWLRRVALLDTGQDSIRFLRRYAERAG